MRIPFRSTLVVLLVGAVALTGDLGARAWVGTATAAIITCPPSKIVRQGVCVYRPEAEHILTIVREQMARHHLHAAIVGIWIGKKKRLTAAVGQSMTGVPATTHMHFRIGSVAIAYLTTLLLQLVDRGLVSLDDPLSKWFPSLPEASSVTLRMLANSSSGYADYVNDPAFVKAFYADVFAHWTQRRLIRIGLSRPLQNSPGTKFTYAHTNFVILGQVLQKITGKPVGALMRQNILNPLRLHNTDSFSTPQIRQPVLHAFTSERGTYEESTYWNPSWTLASGAIMTSDIDDLGKSAMVIGTGSLLSPSSHRAQLRHYFRISPPGKPPVYYGLGVFSVNGWILQNPSFSGYADIMAYLPSKKISIAVASTLGSKSNSDVNYSTQIFDAIARYLAPNHPPS